MILRRGLMVVCVCAIHACSLPSHSFKDKAPVSDDTVSHPSPGIGQVDGHQQVVNQATSREVTRKPVKSSEPKKHDQPVYSVSAINVPAAELLYRLSVNAHKQLNLSSQVNGKVTINATNQPLNEILERISLQVGAVCKIKGDTISIFKDMPYWHSYKLDYVNVSKKVEDSTVMKMSVGNIGQNTKASRKESSEFRMRVTSNNQFWHNLYQDILAIAYLPKNKRLLKHLKQTKDKQRLPKEMAPSVKARKPPVYKERVAKDRFQPVVVNPEAGLISVYTNHKNQAKVKRYLEMVMHRVSKQVLIEATVVEVELNDQYQAGIDWKAVGENISADQSLIGLNLSKSPYFSVNIGKGNFNLKMLQQFGNTKVLSSPKIMAMNNQSAMLKVVKNQVYFTVRVNREAGTTTNPATTTTQTTVHTVPVGFMMNMTPFISDDNKVSINIRPTLSRIVSYVNDPNPDLAKESISSQIPVIQEREMDSILKLRDRQTAIIGGLIQNTHSNERVEVPILSSIPGLGNLFSYRNDVVKKTELIIFIRPVIVKSPDVKKGDLKAYRPFLTTEMN